MVNSCVLLLYMQGSTEAGPSSGLQSDSQYQHVHALLSPEYETILTTAATKCPAAAQRQPVQLANKPVPLPTPLCSSGMHADPINTAAASAAEGQAQMGTSIGSMPLALTSIGSDRQPSASFEHDVGTQAARGKPSAQQRAAVYLGFAPNSKGMIHMMHMSPAATMYVGPPGLSLDFIPFLPAPPPPPAQNSDVSRSAAPQAGHMQVFTSQRQGRLPSPQHAARAKNHYQFHMQPDFQQQPARHAEVQPSVRKGGQSINSLGRHARPVRISSRATRPTSGRGQVSRLSNPSSSTSSLQSIATGKHPACPLYTQTEIMCTY